MPTGLDCLARDGAGRYRGTHKPTEGVYDGQPRSSCAWCGIELEPAPGGSKIVVKSAGFASSLIGLKSAVLGLVCGLSVW